MMKKAKWIIIAVTVLLAGFALFEINNLSNQIRKSEQEKVKLWANAISQKAELVNYSEQFFASVALDEHRKMEMYTNILRSFDRRDMGADADFSLDYVRYIVDSCETAIIITNRDSVITVPSELAGQKLEGELLQEFSHNKPFHYRIWGMPMTLYYKESKVYTDLRDVLDRFNQSFLSEITNNSVFVPVIIVDSTRTHPLAIGNLDSNEVSNPAKLLPRLEKMASVNDPIEISLPGNNRAYVYYENSPLLRSLRWVPLFYFIIGLVLLVVAYYIFRTARTAEQNRIWVGLAKETAHQLGTPLSSLSGWTQYLRGKEFSDEYATEVEKDIQRLEIITHRFSKIGSVPELKEENVANTVGAAIEYLRSRAPRKVQFAVSFPEDEQFIAPLNSYLFQWVIENLCKNAIDAMEGSGTITIVGSQDARNIYIDISDTGKGMSPSVQKKIFDSGFTTKSRGWGLGLPLARRIVNQYHRGRLFLKYSVPGQGTTFRIVLRKK